MNCRLFSCLLLAFGAFVAGCNNPAGDSDRPKTAQVTGTVVYAGKPVEGATVTLIPDSPEAKGAVGRTDADGKFMVTTFDPNDGAIPGSYKVTISKTVLEGAPTEEESEAMVAKGQQPPSGTLKEYLPEKYKDPSTSGLNAQIKDGDNALMFELKD